MIEVGFAIILGFAIASTIFGLMEDGSQGDRILMRALIYLIVLATIVAIFSGQGGGLRSTTVSLALGSIFEHTLWFLGGAVMALCFQLVVEGHLYEL